MEVGEFYFWHLLIFVFPLGNIFFAWLNRRFTEIGISSKRILIKTGLISRKAIDMPLRKVESHKVTQGIIERILGSGTLVFKGTGTAEITLKNIDKPFALAHALSEAIEAAQAQ